MFQKSFCLGSFFPTIFFKRFQFQGKISSIFAYPPPKLIFQWALRSQHKKGIKTGQIRCCIVSPHIVLPLRPSPRVFCQRIKLNWLELSFLSNYLSLIMHDLMRLSSSRSNVHTHMAVFPKWRWNSAPAYFQHHLFLIRDYKMYGKINR